MAVTDALKDLLIKMATNARENAYVPYSGFRVGAALATEKGIYEGVNIENASYGATICGERSPIAAAVSDGAKEFQALAIVTDMVEPAMPCGICRQVMAEFFSADMPILIANLNGKVIETTIAELLPGAFREFEAR